MRSMTDPPLARSDTRDACQRPTHPFHSEGCTRGRGRRMAAFSLPALPFPSSPSYCRAWNPTNGLDGSSIGSAANQWLREPEELRLVDIRVGLVADQHLVGPRASERREGCHHLRPALIGVVVAVGEPCFRILIYTIAFFQHVQKNPRPDLKQFEPVWASA